jgi:ketosteroid isomerase-like protein
MHQVRLGMLSAVGALVVVAAACGGGNGQEFGRTEVNAITQLSQDFAAAYNAKDVDKTVSSFSGAAVLMPPNASTLRGTEPIKGYYSTRFAEGATDLVIEPKDISGHGPLAYVSGGYSVHIRPEGGGETRDRGKFLWIARNMGGGQWRWEYQMWSSDLPSVAPVPPAPEK